MSASLTPNPMAGQTESLLSTDHLGTPFVATDDTGAEIWSGGFEPFGREWLARTPEGAQDNGICLRFPGHPQDSKAFAHTHPTRASTGKSKPEPSQNDQQAAQAAGQPVCTVSPKGVWKFDPSTGKITKELSSGWSKGPKTRCNRRCPQILQ